MKNFILLLFSSFVFLSCKKGNDHQSCYDSSLVHDNFCTTDCPGFLGCDGKTYCNACEAARLGIGPN